MSDLVAPTRKRRGGGGRTLDITPIPTVGVEVGVVDLGVHSDLVGAGVGIVGSVAASRVRIASEWLPSRRDPPPFSQSPSKTKIPWVAVARLAGGNHATMRRDGKRAV